MSNKAKWLQVEQEIAEKVGAMRAERDAARAERDDARAQLALTQERAATASARVIELEQERDSLKRALKLIADHPHNSYDSFEGHAPHIDRQYEIGATDGHRCAAQIARDVLEGK